MPRTGRRAYILLCMVPGRGNPSLRCRRCDHRLVLTETRQALFMELRIGNRTTLFAHARLAESAVCFEEPIVTFALDDVLPGSIRTDGHGYDGRQASRREAKPIEVLRIMTITCDKRLRANTREGVSVPHKLVVKIRTAWRSLLPFGSPRHGAMVVLACSALTIGRLAFIRGTRPCPRSGGI